MKKNILMGTRYFDKDKQVIKISKVKNQDTFSALNSNGERFTITRDELEKEYTKLIPNGHILFSIVENNGFKDVIIALYRTKQFGEEAVKNLPYCVCRQNIVNLFYEVSNINFTHIGMCISIETCPSNVNYELVIACDKIDYAFAIAVYMDDTIDNILKMFKHDKFNTVLKASLKNNTVFRDGYVSTLEELLKQESFSYDFYRAFGIHEIDFSIKYNKENLLLDREQLMWFENEYKIEMFDAYVVEFSYKIRLRDIEKKYILVFSKEDNMLYIIVYTEGKYLNDYMRSEIKNLKNQAAFFNTKLIK